MNRNLLLIPALILGALFWLLLRSLTGPSPIPATITGTSTGTGTWSSTITGPLYREKVALPEVDPHHPDAGPTAWTEWGMTPQSAGVYFVGPGGEPATSALMLDFKVVPNYDRVFHCPGRVDIIAPSSADEADVCEAVRPFVVAP